MHTRETRAFATDFDIREATDAETVGFRGYAAVFDSPSNGEVVRRTAFNKTLSDRDPVAFLVNHDGVPIASSDSGTMNLGVDGRGLFVEVDHLDMGNPRVQEVVSAMKRRDLKRMSFAFVDMTPPEERFDNQGVRNLRDVKLYDVSVVTFPWYEDTIAELNSIEGAFEVIKRGGKLTKEQRDMLIKVVVYCDDDGDMAVDMNDIGETEPLPAADMPMQMNSAPLWRLEAARALVSK